MTSTLLVARRTMSEPPLAVEVRYDVTDGRISRIG